MYSTSWNEFIGKNSKNLTNAFEVLARVFKIPDFFLHGF